MKGIIFVDIDYIGRIILCLEQKNLFIVNILDITKQLEVKSRNEVVDFDNLLTQRGEYMARIDKCKALVDTCMVEIPACQRDELVSILSSGEYIGDASQLITIAALVTKYAAALNQLVLDNKVAVGLITARHTQLRDKVNETRIHRESLYTT